MWSLLAGALTLNGYSAFSVAWITLPLGRMNCLSDGSPVRWLGSSLVPTPDIVPLSAIVVVDGIVPSIISRRSSSSSIPIMYRLFSWGSVSSTVLLARIPFSCRRSNLHFPFFSYLVSTACFCYGCELARVTECYTAFIFMLFDLALKINTALFYAVLCR